MQTRKKVLTRVAAVVLMALAITYLVRLTGLVLATRQAEQREAELAARVALLQSSVDALGASVEWSATDDYVEEWARNERKWVRYGDRPVVLVPATGAAQTDAAPAQPSGGHPLERLKRWLGGQ